MGLRPNLLTRRTAGVATSTLALLLSTAAVGVVPAASAFSAAPAGVCAEPADAHADEHANARVAKGGNAKLDPNHLTAKQVRDREADLAAAQRERASFRTGAVAPLATVTIPVVVHVIQENSTRAGGNITDSMINQQITVLNQSYAGSTGGAATAFGFQLTKINRVTNPSWYPIVQAPPPSAR